MADTDSLAGAAPQRSGVSRRALLGASAATVSVGLLPPLARATGASDGGELAVDVAVVGAGLAGLATAEALAAAGASVVVLEARDRVGGRILDVPLDGGAIAPLGAAWVHPENHRVLALAARAGARLREVKHRTAEVAAPAVAAPALRRLDVMAEHLDPAAPWGDHRAAGRDSLTLGAWITSQAVDRTTAAALTRLAEAVWGVPPAEVSLLQALADAAAAGSAARLAELATTPPLWVEGGAAALVEHLAARLGDRVVLATPVRRIDHDPAGALVTADRLAVRAGRVVVAVPPPVAAGIDIRPAAAHRLLAQRLPMGSVATVACTYPARRLRAQRRLPAPDAPGAQEAATLLHPVTVVPAGGGQWVAVGQVTGAAARRWSAASAEERRLAVLGDLVARFGPHAARPVAYAEHDWLADPWTSGGWAAVAPPGVLTGFGPALREPDGPVHWAGAETASEWTGRLEGALESAERVAAEVLGALPEPPLARGPAAPRPSPAAPPASGRAATTPAPPLGRGPAAPGPVPVPAAPAPLPSVPAPVPVPALTPPGPIGP